ncbi:uncharacterized protein LOC130729304 isoform X2 [Lotus japonicus]|uniref:uncharacterized protein LOC130729304 isoform X2 n=1 Tax=Lotus japonicus TaxID=34305 RepID=UPI002586AEDB|nr:uncharacterized protein LOC130729304 isoform X2 [Lotus japonicus]
MSSPTTYPVVVDDKDLDDAALWAMIDSATASRKSLVSKHHSPSPISKSSPPAPKFQRLSGDSGEVVHDPWPYRPPRKIARICSSEESSPLALVRSVQRTTPPAKVYSSPETGKLSEAQSSPLALVRSVQRMPPAKVYSSPETGKLSEATQELSSYTEVSPRCFGRGEEEKENSLRHSLSGSFPSVSLFKEYQNAAMAILEKTDYTLISGNPYIKKTVTATGIDFFVTSGVAGSQMVGALVTDVKRDFRNQTMISQAQRKLEPKIKLVKTCWE